MDDSFVLDPDVTVDELLNNATEWLKYAHGVTDLLIESMEDVELPDRRRMVLVLGAVSTLTDLGARCAVQAHARMQWDKV